jgi:hypothetical protein
MEKSYIGYKGFDKDLKSSRYSSTIQYVVGETYTSSFHGKGKPRTCTDQGFHYCDTLEEVINKWYTKDDDRYCKVEILGEWSIDSDKKCSTTKMKILGEISKEEIQKVKQKIKNEKIEKNINLDFIKEFQTKFPTAHIGGSAGLFLQGIKLSRLESNKSHDLDFCMPYYVNILDEWSEIFSKPSTSISDDLLEDIDKELEWGSGNDFDNCYTISYKGSRIIIDMKIDNSQKYRTIEYNGFKYKVSPWEIILESKLKYAQKNINKKHRHDLEEILGLRSRTQN